MATFWQWQETTGQSVSARPLHARPLGSDPPPLRSVRRMARLRFGAFLAPHHPTGEHPTLQFQRDLELAAHLDRLGFDEFWCGEHHSSGWETIASPEMFLAAAGQRRSTIRLGTGVVSLPYHHPFNVAQRMVQLDHMTRGRAMFGSGPGALPSDARTHGIDPVLLRDRQDEALGVIIRLLRGEDRFSYECDWFELHDAQLQMLPMQEDMPMVTASSISPSGMQIAGKYGIGVLSIASNSTEGIHALPTQWGFAEEAAAAARLDRRPGGLAGADGVPPRRDPRAGAQRGRPRAAPLAQRVQRLDPRPPGRVARRGQVGAARATTGGGATAPAPRSSARPTTWSPRSATCRRPPAGSASCSGSPTTGPTGRPRCARGSSSPATSIPEINGRTRRLRASQQYLHDNQAELMGGASRAVMSKIMAHEGAAKAMATRWSRSRRASRPASTTAAGVPSRRRTPD